MSVWDIPHHLDDALIHALDRISKDPMPEHLLQSLANFKVTEIPGFATNVPDGILANNLPKRTAQMRMLYPSLGNRHDRAWDHTIAHYEALKLPIKCGLAAVYELCAASYEGKIPEPNEIDFKEVSKFASMLSRQCYTSGHSATATINQVGKHAAELMRRVPKARELYQLSSAFDHTLGYARAQNYSQACSEASQRKLPAPYTSDVHEDRGIDLGDTYKVRICNGTIFVDVFSEELAFHPKVDHVLYLTPKDIKRLCETINGMAQTLLYPRLCSLYDADYDKHHLITRVLDHIVGAMKTAPDPGNVARFYDVGLHTLIAHWGSDLDKRPLEKMRDKYKEEQLHLVGDMQQYVGMLRREDPQTALDAARVYKLLPCPDFDPFTDFAAQALKQANKNPWFSQCPEDISEAEFEQWRKLQACRIAVMCQDSIGAVSIDVDKATEELGSSVVADTADAILARDDKSLPLSMAPYLDPTGLLPMIDLDAIVPDTLKDKSLCPADVTGEAGDPIDATGDRWSANYLLEHMRTAKPKTADECLTKVSRSTMKHYHKVFFKPETKKAHARNCYSAQSLCRKALSKVELSVAEYLRLRRGNANGVPDYEITNDILECINGHEGRYLAISFDISGWSPNMAHQATRSSLNKWSQLFGDSRVAEVHRVLTHGVAVWNHGFLQQSYALNGTDLEGYLGRVNTDYHIDVMTYALHVLARRMRQHEDPNIQKWSGFSANLQVMIDDGLLILSWDASMPTVDHMPTAVLDYISGSIEEVYEKCSLKLSWDKTIISDRCMTFLNEVYKDGVHIGNGLRSYVRIRPDRDAIPSDYHEKTHRYTAMAQGALKSGAPMIAVVIAMGYQLGMEIEHTKKMPRGWGASTASMLFLPTAYGGANMPSISLLGASAGGDAFAVSLGNCRRIAASDAHFKGCLARQLRHPPIVATPLQTLRDPTGIHTTAVRLTTSLLRTAIASQLPKITRNVELRALLRLNLDEEAVSILASLGMMATPEAIARAYSASRVHLVDRLMDKFKKANSLAGVLPKRKIRSVERACVRALATSVAEYMKKF